jgi:hypothetical protein
MTMGSNNNADKASAAMQQSAAAAREEYNRRAQQGIDYANARYNEGRGDINNYYNKGESYLNPYMEAGKSSLDSYLGGLGLGGEKGRQAVMDQFRSNPGYQAGLEEGQNSINRQRAAMGGVHGGAILKELNRFSQDYADKNYNQYMDRLGNLAGMGSNISQFLAGQANQTGSNLAGMGQNQGNMINNAYTGMGENAANAELAAGNARANAEMNKNNSPWYSGVGALAGSAIGSYLNPGSALAGMAGKFLGGGR